MQLTYTSVGYPGLGCGTSPAWYTMFNEAILAWRYLQARGLREDFEQFKIQVIPAYEQAVKSARWPDSQEACEARAALDIATGV